ncbi:MAG TPA: 4'-phosphopantetheinyl transferase superfamily protein, partial [Dehalococcoidia bacterium]|nr:4'-phosphopantetheinyl transferase superfamily protein [Dehalococcoidia bacterium]
PHQTVVAGEPQAAAAAAERMRAQGIICETLPFDRAYHTPLFKRYLAGLHELMGGTAIFAPDVETWSCASMSPFPRDPDAIRKLAVEHWARPVEFTKTIEAMYAAGVRLFVEVGPRGNLTAFVDDILRGRPYLALPANVQRRSGITQLNHLVGILAAQGIPLRLDYLYAQRSPKELPIDRSGEAEAEKRPSARMKLNTGWPPMNISEEAVRKVRSRREGPAASPPTNAAHPEHEVAAAEALPKTAAPSPNGAATAGTLWTAAPAAPRAPGGLTAPMLAYLQTMEQFLAAQEEVMRAYLGAPGALPIASAAPLIAPPAATHEDRPADTGAAAAGPTASGPVAAAPQEEKPQAQAEGLDFETARDSLLTLVSDRTGYPPDMLDLNMDLEADLGIDSIKRIEILGAFRAKHGLAADDERMESMAEMRTLQQILEFLVALEQDDGEPAILVPSGPEPAGGNGAAPAAPARRFPLIGEVTRFVAGEELTARREVRWDEDLYLHDHTLGRGMSATDSDLRALPVMPLTMSMEMLAEAGALLMPDRVLVGMRNVQAHRWIKLDGHSVTLEILARRLPDSANEVEVKVFEAQSEGAGAPPLPLVEGIMVFADAYPEAPAVGELALRDARPSRFTPAQLYGEAMFHGPRWQGVESIDRWGEDGTVSTLRVIPFDDFFRSDPEPRFVTDPVVLDAAGQVVGFWTQEHLKSGFVVFPYRLNELQVFGPGLPAGSRLRCQARIQLVGDKRVSSDIDILRPDGSLWMRLVGWADRRFDLPGRLYRFLLSPKGESIAAPWPEPVSSFNGARAFECFRVNGLFPSDEAFWTDVFAHLTLSPSERSQFVRRRGATGKRSQWLMGRLAAKDAVRALLRSKYDLELCPADIEIGKGEAGQPVAEGAWTRHVQKPPVLSLAHTEGLAVAVAGIGDNLLRLGVDVEPVRPMAAGFEEEAFAARERELLAPLRGERRDEWVMRLWCAKEAVGKGLGRGLLEGPQSVVAERLDLETGTVWTRLRGKLAADFAELAETSIAAYTTRDGQYVVATTLCERS